MKYEIINENGIKNVHFHEEEGERIIGKSRPVKMDEDGHEYVTVPNPKNPKHASLFTGRIKDAVEQIRNGIGDCIISRNGIPFGSSHIISVVMFLDREYGEKIKKKFIDGWKDAKFAYSVCGYYRRSISGPTKFTEDGEIWNDWFPEVNKKPFVSFSSEEEAEELIKKWTKMAIEASEKYKVLDSIQDRNSDEAKKIMEYTKALPYVVLHLTSNHYEPDSESGDYILEVTQELIIEERV